MTFIHSSDSVMSDGKNGLLYALDNAFNEKKFDTITSYSHKLSAFRESPKILDKLIFVGDINEAFVELKEKGFVFSTTTFQQKERRKQLGHLFKKLGVYHSSYNSAGKEYESLILK